MWGQPFKNEEKNCDTWKFQNSCNKMSDILLKIYEFQDMNSFLFIQYEDIHMWVPQP